MKNMKNRYIIIPIITAVLSMAIYALLNFGRNSLEIKNYTDFVKDVTQKQVSTVYITNSPKVKVELKNGTRYETDNPRTDKFKETLLINNIKVSEGNPISLKEVVPIGSFLLSVIAIFFIFFKSAALNTNGIFNVANLELNDSSNIGFTFESVAGNEEAKESVKDIVDFLKNPDKYTSYGARMPKGIILYGEPGTGKTLLAKAVAGEAGVPFYAMSGSDFVQMYVGVGASRIRNLFKKARSSGKAVIFIDEIDAIGKKRESNKAGSSDERDQTLNALLTEMSGFNEKEGIVVMAATNRLDMLDPALLRPGRFDRHIEITLPDLLAREKILSLHLKDKPTADININEWAQKTSYFSGAKLESLINEAAIIACKENSYKIANEHLDKAFSIVLAGYEKVERGSIKETDRRITAFHESGHALISSLVLPKEKVSKVTIIPSTKGAGGYTLSIPEDNMYQNKDYLEKRIKVLLGGRAAEEIVFGKDFITTGAYNDLKNSTNIIFNMVTKYGMGNTLGLLSVESLASVDMNNQKEVLTECKNIVDGLYEEVKKLLIKNKNKLDKLTYSLLDKETLHYEEINKILN